jgi:hypothetical protein
MTTNADQHSKQRLAAVSGAEGGVWNLENFPKKKSSTAQQKLHNKIQSFDGLRSQCVPTVEIQVQ